MNLFSRRRLGRVRARFRRRRSGIEGKAADAPPAATGSVNIAPTRSSRRIRGSAPHTRITAEGCAGFHHGVVNLVQNTFGRSAVIPPSSAGAHGREFRATSSPDAMRRPLVTACGAPAALGGTARNARRVHRSARGAYAAWPARRRRDNPPPRTHARRRASRSA